MFFKFKKRKYCVRQICPWSQKSFIYVNYKTERPEVYKCLSSYLHKLTRQIGAVLLFFIIVCHSLDIILQRSQPMKHDLIINVNVLRNMKITWTCELIPTLIYLIEDWVTNKNCRLHQHRLQIFCNIWHKFISDFVCTQFNK